MATTSTPFDHDYRPSYRAAAITSAAIFVLYVLTLAPTTAMWDTSEYITAAYTLGLPHPPGNPLFVLIGRVFAILPIAPTVAVRINLLAAICSSVSAGMWFLITERVLVSWFVERWQRILGGVIAAGIGATAFTVWNQSVVNEKVYTVSLMGIAIISWLMVRWCDAPDGRKADRTLVLVAYICGLGYANHMAGMLPAPAVGLAVLLRRPATIARWPLLLACAAAIVVGMTPFGQTVRFEGFPFVDGARRIIGSNYGSAVAALAFPRYAEWFLQGRLPIDRLIDRRLPLEDLDDAFDRLRAGQAARQVVVFGDA